VSVATSENVKTLPFAKAINAGLRKAMQENDRVLLMGEDIGPLGGVFRVTEGLQAEFGEDRVVDTPLAESGIVGTAIGLAMRGYRPVCEIQFDGFIFPAFDQITTQLAKMNYRSRGRVNLPVVIRVPYGGGIGAIEHHSESPEALFAHTPGLRVVTPGSAQDAYTMIQEAIASPDPVLFFEPKGRYWEKGQVDLDAQIGATTLNKAVIARTGTDVTVVAYGPTVATALRAAEAAKSERPVALWSPTRPRPTWVRAQKSRHGLPRSASLIYRPRFFVWVVSTRRILWQRLSTSICPTWTVFLTRWTAFSRTDCKDLGTTCQRSNVF
jgi:pyruvate dehydrogenase E1 component beta subunit